VVDPESTLVPVLVRQKAGVRRLEKRLVSGEVDYAPPLKASPTKPLPALLSGGLVKKMFKQLAEVRAGQR